MWFWSADSVERELFDLYAPALQSLGVNFNDEQLQDSLEASSYGLEDAFRSAIVYILWLEENLKPILPDCDTNRGTGKSMAHQILEAGVSRT
ncbi:hypothetical protein [Nostoc sphaeroides]|uniref:hypothetical protein n=1 Tax=Nostoc sphaeroides TaxID=446679 RepID=UPI002B3FFEC7|nr:hypothetical protein [Nostoc sphaeroides]